MCDGPFGDFTGMTYLDRECSSSLIDGKFLSQDLASMVFVYNDSGNICMRFLLLSIIAEATKADSLHSSIRAA